MRAAYFGPISAVNTIAVALKIISQNQGLSVSFGDGGAADVMAHYFLGNFLNDLPA